MENYFKTKMSVEMLKWKGTYIIFYVFFDTLSESSTLFSILFIYSVSIKLTLDYTFFDTIVEHVIIIT